MTPDELRELRKFADVIEYASLYSDAARGGVRAVATVILQIARGETNEEEEA